MLTTGITSQRKRGKLLITGRIFFFRSLSPTCRKIFKRGDGGIAEPAKGLIYEFFDGSGVAKGRAPEERARRD
jgi:hypothetical protein